MSSQSNLIDDCQCCNNKGFVSRNDEFDGDISWSFCPLNCVARVLFKSSFECSKNPFVASKEKRANQQVANEIIKFIETFLPSNGDADLSYVDSEIKRMANKFNIRRVELMSDPNF